VNGNFSWLLGVAALILIVAVILNGINTEGPGSRGVPVGQKLPPFAAPLALSDMEFDANVARADGSGASGAKAACSVRGKDILNVCELYEDAPVVLVFFATKSTKCLDQVDVVNRVLRNMPGIRAAAVAIRGGHDEVRRIVRERNWKLPVGWDRDGAVSNLYAVAVCPTITYAKKGGRVESTALGLVDEKALREKLAVLR
jgi:hypothetical protein